MTLPLSEGQRLGNYRLHRLLGRGSYADVYLGEHLYLQTAAAIKILQRTLDEEEEQLFLAEARTIARLAHPNIIRVREFAIERSTPFLAMDYAPGGTLRRRYPKGTCLSLQQTMIIIKQIAAALQYAHNHGLIHRDVKPENVLQGAEQVMLSDFGISITAPPLHTTLSQSWAGTLPYMAPEQFQGQATFASDQYALAIMAYEWLCGERPFEGSETTLAYQHTHVPPPRLREKDPSLPEAVEAVVLKALSKHPEQRYVSVLTFARALERACRGERSYTINTTDETERADASHAASAGRVFLSHAASDDVRRLDADLTLRNLAVLYEETSSSQDTDALSQEERTRRAIRAAQVVLLVLTPHTRTEPAVHNHLRIARLYRRKILCFWREGETLQDLLPAGAEQATILDARDLRYKVALDEVILAIEREQRGVTNIEPVLPELTFEPRNPYKGLQAFSQHDRADFFGRQTLVQELLVRLREQLVSPVADGVGTARLLAVIGPSGSGKSSVVMAGLLPALQDGALPGSADWIYLDPLAPGPQSLEALASLLAARFPRHDPQVICQMLGKQGGFGLHQVGMTLVNQPHMRIVVTIDQFEQIFSSDISEPDRLHFLQMLVRAATEPHGPILVLLTLRADFYDRPFAYPELGRLIQQYQCTILPMNLDELREVIERPALLPDVRLTFDEDLVGDLLFDLQGQNTALPLLSFTLEQLFYHRRGHRLTRAAYHEIGGVRGALSQHAEATYAALPSEEHRRMARTLFLRLVQSGERGQDPLRRRAEISEFELRHAEQNQMLQQVINAFLTARLITSSRSVGISTLEISHEALLREWPRLALWVREAQEDLQLQQTIRRDVHEWERRGKPRDRLYRGSQLKEALAWQERNTASSSEVAFLQASTARRTRSRISILLSVLLLLALLFPTGLVLRQRFLPLTVTTLEDDAPGSLREAVSNALPGGTIIIDPRLKGIITLKKTLVLSKNLTIRGPGINQVTVRGTRDQGYLIYVPHNVAVTLSKITFSDPTPAMGPMIKNEGTLTLDTCQVTGNTETGIGEEGTGGVAAGIENNGGILTLQNSIVSRNTITASPGGFGGGIGSYKGTLTISNSQIVDNAVISNGPNIAGGGISVTETRITVINSVIARNKVVGGQKTTGGGGISSIKSILTLKNSTVIDNSVETNGRVACGGGILSGDSTITISNSRISGNVVVNNNKNSAAIAAREAIACGGAISSANNQITIENSILSNNRVTAQGYVFGGALDAIENSRVSIANTTITHNLLKSEQDAAAGGGIYNGATLSITDSVISENSASGATTSSAVAGGGIITRGPMLVLKNGTLALNTVTNNKGTAAGGGIYAYQAPGDKVMLELTNCTISGNQAQAGVNGSGKGGGFGMNGSASRIHFCTIAGNVASSQGGGLFIAQTGTSGVNELLLKNSIVAENTSPTGPDISGTLLTGGYNLVQRWTGAQVNDGLKMHQTDLSVKPSAQVGITTQLHVQRGATPTLALQAGSPAIDAIPVSACDVPTDQRGEKRPQHAACDIGAYEYS